MRRTDKKGFTLLEVLVALAILSGTLVLAYRVMSGAITSEARAERWLAATLLAESQVRVTLATFPDTGDTEGKFPAEDREYAWRQRVVQAQHEDAREVHLSVFWKEDGREEQVDVSGIAVK